MEFHVTRKVGTLCMVYHRLTKVRFVLGYSMA